MALATFSVRLDENLKKQFDILCADFGMNASTAFKRWRICPFAHYYGKVSMAEEIF